MPTSRPPLIFVRDIVDPDDSRQAHARRALRGDEQRLARGVYLADGDWQRATARERYLLRVRAVAETRNRPGVLPHWTAASIHDLPTVGVLPRAVHLTVGRTAGGRSGGQVVKHSLPIDDDEIVEVDGLQVTSVARTVVDLAALVPFAAAVIAADGALRVDRFGRTPPLTTHEGLQSSWQNRLPFRGHVRARAVLDFAETRADTPIESLSRVTMRRIGCPAPLLQSSFRDAGGFIGEVDFDWPEFGAIGEADGDRKYLDAAFRSGRTVEQVFLDEKRREDRLRALPKTVARWNWKVAGDPGALAARLRAAGIRW